MPIEFQLRERLAGFVAAPVAGGEEVQVITRELVSPDDAVHLLDRLERMQGVVFANIPGAPSPSLMDHALVVIRPDLSATAYINELGNVRAEVRLNRGVDAGEPIFVRDIENITSIDLGIEIPDDCAVVLLRSFGWRRSLFFDFDPLHDDQVRGYPISEAFAQQALLLIGVPSGAGEAEGPAGRLGHMAEGLEHLRSLLAEVNTEEARYQELLEEHPWMLGGLYSEVRRHARLDDRAIPDFTATRCYDQYHDIIELKQPFLRLFRQDGSLASNFNDAWNQAEEYLAFATRQRTYLRDERQIHIENPRCVLIVGHGLTDAQRRRIREKEAGAVSVSVFTYDELLRTAEHVHRLVAGAGELRFR